MGIVIDGEGKKRLSAAEHEAEMLVGVTGEENRSGL